MGPKGIEFLMGSRFVTFGYTIDGRIVNPYGTFSFSENRVRLQTVGAHFVVNGTNADVKVNLPPSLNQPRYLRYNREIQILEEDDNGNSVTFTREGKRGH